MSTGERRFFLVRDDMLPEVLLKTALVNEMLSKGEVGKVSEAVEKVGLSRSAYYKYRDGVLQYQNTSRTSVISLSLVLEHQPGILSRVLNTVAATGGNILTINQPVPDKGIAPVSLTLDAGQMAVGVLRLLDELRNLSGVRQAQILNNRAEDGNSLKEE